MDRGTAAMGPRAHSEGTSISCPRSHMLGDDTPGEEGDGLGSSIDTDDLTLEPQEPSQVQKLPTPPAPAAPEEYLGTDLECPVCTELFCEPVVTPCQHRFCRNCLGK